MVSTQHLIKDQITGRHAGGLKHARFNPFTGSAAYASASAGFGIGSMASGGVGLNGYNAGRRGCPSCAKCSCCG